MELKLPDFALVLLIGASGSGKTTFAAQRFRPTEILSSDRCRALVSDDESDQSATADAFAILHAIAAKRLERRRLTVIDATNVRPEDRKSLVDLARRYHALPVAIVFDLPETLCLARNATRADRTVPPGAIRDQHQQLRRSRRGLDREGFRAVHVFTREDEVAAARIVREPLWCDRRGEHGPFDIIGDVHGCRDELVELLDRLGYVETERDRVRVRAHPQGRRAIFVGDLVDRGPDSPGVLRVVMDMAAAGSAFAVPGNHDMKLVRKLMGRDVKVAHGLAETLAQLEAMPEVERRPFEDEARRFLDGLVSHLWLDDGRLVVAHAGLKEEMQGRGSGAVRAFATFGETTGETDAFGLPVRLDWAAAYRGRATVVYGHTPTPIAEWVNNTICVDTGCVFGGKLTALRYPERTLVEVQAARTYAEPVRPLAAPGGVGGQHAADAVLDIEDVTGKRSVMTGLAGAVRVEPDHAAAALEAMARFAIDPRWLITLPPTMSPPDTSARADLLEHPDEAFALYARAGVEQVMVEEKQMGSRAIIVLARDAATARDRFGVEDERAGRVYTRTGRAFFTDDTIEDALVGRLGVAMETAGLWDRFGSGWVCLDAELMPWSAKAQALIDTQYRPVGEAALSATVEAHGLAAAAIARGVPVQDLADRLAQRAGNAAAYDAAWRRYAPASGPEVLRVAPFHILASEGDVHSDKRHDWHMATIATLVAADPALLLPTAHRAVTLSDALQVAAAVRWWEELTTAGGEGVVVKPMAFVARGRKGIVQPAVKVRGRDYLRMVYGPDYTMPEHLERLRDRGVGRKRGLALREFALGLEALTRFVAREPLRRVHECVFAILALESEAVDPRL